MDGQGLRLSEALGRREWAALRVLAAAVTLREIRVSGQGSPAAWLHAHDALLAATDAFVDTMGDEAATGGEPCKRT